MRSTLARPKPQALPSQAKPALLELARILAEQEAKRIVETRT